MKTLKIMIGTIIGAIALFGVICGVYYAGLKAGESKKSSEESASVAEPVEAVETPEVKEAETFELSLADIPDYNGKTFVEINNNEPCFDERDINTESFERYSGLDKLGRCGVAYANLSKDTMPVGERGNISEVKPAGWHSDSYDFIEGGNLYNRCHLIAFALSAENANERNLITGTRYMNHEGMKPFEDEVASYIDRSGNHVLYRVTPIFEGDELIARGVEMEALSVEDEGKGIRYHVYVYNVEPGIEIDYATGDNKLSADKVSELKESTDTTRTVVADTDTQENGKQSGNEQKAETKAEPAQAPANAQTTDYVGNKNTMKFHYPDCDSVDQMNPKNRVFYNGVTRQDMINMGYEPCGNCKP